MASILGVMLFASGSARAQGSLTVPPSQLVREVVYNELHDHASHGYWRYFVEKQSVQGTRLEEQIETADGTVMRLVLRDGRPLSPESQQSEQARLDRLLTSPMDRMRLRQEHADDEKRIGRILTLLPDAFLFEYAGDRNNCYELRFRPNPDYPAHSVESRIFHAMSGELWIDARMKHLVRLDGQLQTDVDFGYGILGRLYKGGWFSLQRVQVSATDWKTERLEVHMSGRAMLFKTTARETSELRGNFAAVPRAMNLEQGVDLFRTQDVAGAPSKVQLESLTHLPPSR
jgi:hypothetical protein